MSHNFPEEQKSHYIEAEVWKSLKSRKKSGSMKRIEVSG